MYKFGDKKNREDVIALRWPKACLSCGTDVPHDTHPVHAIVGNFYVDKKTTKGDKRHTQVLVKLPGFFYRCESCTTKINELAMQPARRAEMLKFVETLQESPWMVLIELEKSGNVKIENDLFREKLQEANPEAWLKKKVVLGSSRER